MVACWVCRSVCLQWAAAAATYARGERAENGHDLHWAKHARRLLSSYWVGIQKGPR
jgi:hypothetical protein